MTVYDPDVCYALCDLVMDQVLATPPCPPLLHCKVADIKVPKSDIGRNLLDSTVLNGTYATYLTRS